MKKIFAFIAAFLFASFLQAQPIDYDNLAKEYQDVAIRALASVKPSTKKWVEETALKHPAGKFDINWVNGQVAGMTGGGDPASGLWAVMLSYQRILNKEARAERKASKADAALETKLKEDRMNNNMRAIDQGKQESRERYDNSMQAANTEAGKGISSSSKQVTNEKDKEAAATSMDHKKAMQDNIKKLLDQLAEIQRSGKF